MGQKVKENAVEPPAAAVGTRIQMAAERLAAEYMDERNAVERKMTAQSAVYLQSMLAAIKPKGWK